MSHTTGTERHPNTSPAPTRALGQHMAAELASQPDTWARAASEAFVDRGYDAAVALTRSGTTSEVLELVDKLRGKVRTVGIIGDPESPLVDLVDDAVTLPFADKQSLVQTRFATTALALFRASLTEGLESAVDDARQAIAEDLDPDLIAGEQFKFLGAGWTVGLAHEAALKMREASQSWPESYPAKESRHGPIAIAAPVRTQRVSLARSVAFGLDADAPRSLTRSVVLGSRLP